MLVVIGAAVASGVSVAAERLVTIGSGGDPGVYYSAAAGICRMVNATSADHGIGCNVSPSGGSIRNLAPVHRGEMEFGIVQSDWQAHAYDGTLLFAEDGPFSDLRAVFSLHTEPFTVVARADSGIATFTDLKGRRVNIGNPGSGQRATMEVVLDAIGWTTGDFTLAAELKPSEQSRALCRNDIDAMVFIAGHPNKSIRDAAGACDVELIDVDADIVKRLVSNSDIYEPMTIPGGLYRGTPEDTQTFGVRATVVSSAQVPGDMVYAVAKAVFDDLSAFRKQHPALAHLTPKQMASDGLSAPLHDGAKLYFEEARLK